MGPTFQFFPLPPHFSLSSPSLLPADLPPPSLPLRHRHRHSLSAPTARPAPPRLLHAALLLRRRPVARAEHGRGHAARPARRHGGGSRVGRWGAHLAARSRARGGEGIAWRASGWRARGPARDCGGGAAAPKPARGQAGRTRPASPSPTGRPLSPSPAAPARGRIMATTAVATWRAGPGADGGAGQPRRGGHGWAERALLPAPSHGGQGLELAGLPHSGGARPPTLRRAMADGEPAAAERPRGRAAAASGPSGLHGTAAPQRSKHAGRSGSRGRRTARRRCGEVRPAGRGPLRGASKRGRTVESARGGGHGSPPRQPASLGSWAHGGGPWRPASLRPRASGCHGDSQEQRPGGALLPHADLAPPPTCVPVAARGGAQASADRGAPAPPPTCVSGRGLELGLPHPREARHLELDGWGRARRTKGAHASIVWSFVRTALSVQSHCSVRNDAEPFRP
ncbi:hypothetical protein PVAP13_2KG569501 [Panicum virgatum]|uniref:Uncharacterized protein n=1 Tax=Panicum virgatum TaxID=38727 RepID=A0A8T0WI82_PANVG|nr:hypothetical protein PVAP13_2KG569501 [Panicum virgatum]